MTDSSADNKRGKRGTTKVVVVTKKRFSFASKNSSEKKVDNSSIGAENSSKPDINQFAQTESHYAFEGNLRKSGSKIRNLDDDINTIKKEPPKQNLSTAEAPKAKKIAKNITAGTAHIKKDNTDVIAKDFFSKKDSKTGTKVSKKDMKSFLEDITIVSDSKQKNYNQLSDSSAFLGNKKGYIDDQSRNKNFFDDEEVEQDRLRSIASIKRAREKLKRDKSNFSEEKSSEKTKEVIIPETITVQELANRMSERSANLVKELMKMGMMITASKPIDADTAELLVAEFGMVAKRVADSDIENNLYDSEKDNINKQVSRSPVVSVMGHVDHGKTSLLDALRQTDVVAGESGGITQHIGASKVKVGKNQYITFLDTPGHEAFTAMRLRGAHVTDMVILVVAADDGVKDQTIEAINHAKAANIPIIVAVNKIDKEGANKQKVVTELLEHGVIVEEMGGENLCVEVSAKQKKNLDKLIDAIFLQTEILELKANPECKASGVVIESKIDKNKGVLTTLLVQHGSLKIGDIILAGNAYGRARTLVNDKGNKIDKVCPSEPAELLGLDLAPQAGEQFYVVESEKAARDIVEYRLNKRKNIEAARRSKKTLEDIFSGMTDDKKKKLSLVVKGDVNGSVEAIVNSLEKLSNEEVTIQIIHSAVGGITESDIVLAKASDAIILGFNVRIANNVKDGEAKEVDIRYYSIIYDLVDDIKKAVTGMLKPIIKETSLGKGEIREVFDLTKYGKVAGSYVNSGIVKRSGRCRIIRDSVVVSDTAIKALKHFKDDVKEVKNGMECGISFENCTEFLVGDQLEFFELTEEAKQ